MRIGLKSLCLGDACTFVNHMFILFTDLDLVCTLLDCNLCYDLMNSSLCLTCTVIMLFVQVISFSLELLPVCVYSSVMT